MNNFTKEELERILEGVTWWLDGDNALYCEQLIDKIQSMIDNYCEHTWTDGSGNIIICNKCHFILGTR